MLCSRINFDIGSDIAKPKGFIVDTKAVTGASTTAIGFKDCWPSSLDPKTMEVERIIAFAVKVAISIVVNITVEVFEAVNIVVSIAAKEDTSLVEVLTVAMASKNCLASISFELQQEAFKVAAKLLAGMLIAFLNLNYYIKNIF